MFILNSIRFNKDTYANIPVHGDLIQDMYLNLNIRMYRIHLI